MSETPEKPDDLMRRCPRLGNPISFAYCQSCGEQNDPCFKIFDCWWEIFDVTKYLQNNLSSEQFEKLTMKKPQPKITSIVDLIRQAQERHQEK